MRFRWNNRYATGWLIALGFVTQAVAQDDFDRAPILYSQTQPVNAVSRLQSQLEAGEVQVEWDKRFGYLPSLLDALHIPRSSQLLVFSKTSLQRQRISPRTPRALYFNDDVYVGYCHQGDVLEISVADPALGTVFYVVEQNQDQPPAFVREGDNCLICHGGSQTRNIPGHVVRSTYPDNNGQPVLTSGSYRTDHTTPLEHRWGGWYITGLHDQQKHLGNRIYRSRPLDDEPIDTSGYNVTNLEDRFRTDLYLTPDSDLAAMLVFEHQAGGHNVLTRAAFATRSALHREDSLNRELKEPPEHRWESTTTILRSSARSLATYFLMANEATLPVKLEGTTNFAGEFAVLGPRDSAGRSLRELQLSQRLFRYPCSYLVYTDSFAALPEELRQEFWRLLDEVLSGRDQSKEFAHLTTEDRQSVRDILRATCRALPEGWGTTTPSAEAPEQ